jgi:hypothetical protein
MLTFIYIKKKNYDIIKRRFPDLTGEQTRAYYQFAKEIKQSMYGYINYDKLTQLLHQEQP